MSVLKKIREALAPLNIPITPYIGEDTKPIYGVITELLEQPELFADNGERLTGYYAQIDFIAKTNIEDLVKKANQLLTNAGFVRRDKRAEYVKDAKVYRHMLRVFLLTDYEEDMTNG